MKYKLVPIEPTQEMIDEGRTARTHPRERYKAMLAAAPAVEQEPFAWISPNALSRLSPDSPVNCALVHKIRTNESFPLYLHPQPTPNKLNAYREQVTEVEAPSHSLPDWSECNLRVGNSEWLKDNDRKPEHDSLTANPLHEFIYEYDDSDAYKSAWFLHRLEKLIGFIKSEQVPTSDVSVLVEALERISDMDTISYHSLESAKIVARKALAAHRKHGGKS